MTNLYADAIFAENPTALWALDDDLAVASLSALPSNIALSGYGTPALAYGSERNQGYYIGTSSTTSTLKARASGVPMVYGATNITSLDANSTNPSLIIPGLGFLNEDGKNKKLTLEVWLRAYPTAHIPRRIIGPITGDNGLYVNGQFLTLKIGDNIGSHYVGEWGRPMLVHIYYTGTSAGVILNGESVISINYEYQDIEFPTKLDDSSDDQDWIGFYGYSDVSLLQLDCISIYAYQILIDKAKLHFVKGQSVESPEIKNTSYFDVPMIIDYQMSKYANNYIYPGNGRWRNGIINNLSTDNNVLSAPEYQLPQLVLEDGYQTLRAWNSLQRDLTGQSDTTTLSDGEVMDNDVFFRIVPDNADNVSADFNYAGYLYFDKFNVLQDPTKAIYGVFSVSSVTATEGTPPYYDELLFRITNSSNEYFEAVIKTNDIIYRFVSPTGNVTVTSSDVVTANTKFVAGINIDAFVAQQNNQQISRFFNNSADLKVFLGGPGNFNGGSTIDNATPKLFRGNIYKFGFMNQNNLNKILAEFTNGIADNDNVTTTFNTHFASYTLIGVNTLNSFSLDIAVNGTWKDYISLSQLDKQTVRDAGGNVASSLDFIQFNIDVPELADVTNSSIRTYVEFSEIATSVVSANQITKTAAALQTDYEIQPDADDSWINKKYELVNNTIVYPPTVGFNSYSDLGFVTHIEFFIPGIIRNPAKIKMLHIASQALNYSAMKTPIGTRYGKDIYSFGADRSYSAKNPYTIYKNTTPYLYLTNYSGIKLVGTTFNGTRGIEIPVNEFAKPYYTVSVLEASALQQKTFTAEVDVEIFRIKHGTGTAQAETFIIYATGTDSNYAELKAKKLSNGTDLGSAVKFFVNGVEDATIRYGEWNMIGIVFTNLLRFGGSSLNRIDITGPFVVNNISDYQIDEAAENNNYTFYTWSETAAKTWTQVAAASATWNDTLISDTAGPPPQLDAAAIYSSYFGNSRISANEDSYTVGVNQKDYNSYVGVRSSLVRTSPL